MKSIGDIATIRWYGPRVPVAGDVLRTPTGRQYLVDSVKGRLKRTLVCIVVPSSVPHTRPMWWVKRRRRVV